MGYSPLFGTWLTRFHYIWAAPDIIAACYAKVGRLLIFKYHRNSQARLTYFKTCREPFAIRSLAEYQVLVSSQKHVKELGDSPEEQLSFHAAMEDVSSGIYGAQRV